MSRGRKNLPFEGGYRVPFIARWPDRIPAGSRSDKMTMNFDIFALCLDIVGVQPPSDRMVDGVSLLPLLLGENTNPHDTLFFFKGNHLLGVRHNDWKYLRRHMTDNGGYATLSQGPFLFNLFSDPNESYSLIESKPNVVNQLTGLLEDFDQIIRQNIRGWK
jgi:arylsulfatase A-like enzyme